MAIHRIQCLQPLVLIELIELHNPTHFQGVLQALSLFIIITNINNSAKMTCMRSKYPLVKTTWTEQTISEWFKSTTSMHCKKATQHGQDVCKSFCASHVSKFSLVEQLLRLWKLLVHPKEVHRAANVSNISSCPSTWSSCKPTCLVWSMMRLEPSPAFLYPPPFSKQKNFNAIWACHEVTQTESHFHNH